MHPKERILWSTSRVDASLKALNGHGHARRVMRRIARLEIDLQKDVGTGKEY
jgi:hypothetical protein